MDSYLSIMDEPDPQKDKHLGRLVTGFDQSVWDANVREILFHGNLAKLQSDIEFVDLFFVRGFLCVQGGKFCRDDLSVDYILLSSDFILSVFQPEHFGFIFFQFGAECTDFVEHRLDVGGDFVGHGDSFPVATVNTFPILTFPAFSVILFTVDTNLFIVRQETYYGDQIHF
ncbi:MAG: hypothetical protein IKX19_08510, partial [Clostridia bacterium]|nr:hypothetical protein [Clostridia bacterium]